MTAREPAGARESATGAIYDLGYRGYDGPRLGRRAAVTTLFWHSLRAAFGLGRGGRAKIVPWGLAAFALVPAVVTAAITALVPGGGASALTYDSYLFDTAAVLSLFVAAQAPELVSADQRHHVLALYFSHALARSDYALAKLAAMTAAVYVVCVVPLLVLFLGAVLAASDVGKELGDQAGNLAQIGLAPLIYALPLSALGLAIAAWTPRRAYATGAIIAVFIVTAAIAGILEEATSGQLADWAQLVNPFVAADGARDWLVGGPNPTAPVNRSGLPLAIFGAETLLITLGGVGAAVWRYRRLAA